MEQKSKNWEIAKVEKKEKRSQNAKGNSILVKISCGKINCNEMPASWLWFFVEFQIKGLKTSWLLMCLCMNDVNVEKLLWILDILRINSLNLVARFYHLEANATPPSWTNCTGDQYLCCLWHYLRRQNSKIDWLQGILDKNSSSSIIFNPLRIN